MEWDITDLYETINHEKCIFNLQPGKKIKKLKFIKIYILKHRKKNLRRKSSYFPLCASTHSLGFF